MLVLLTVALGHMPMFNPEPELTIKAEPSQALYLRRPTTITVDYKAGDYMYVLLLKSQKQGQWRSGTTVDAGIEDQTVCTPGSAATDSHAKVHSPGDTIYEPFAEGTYTVISTHLHSQRALVDQSCVFYVNATGPTNFVVGTREEGLAEMVLVGLPHYTMRVSAWAGFYTYGFLLAVWGLVVVTAYWLGQTLRPMFIAAGVYGVTALHRFVQLSWSDPGPGLAFSLQPIACSIICVVLGDGNPKYRWRLIAAVGVLTLFPERTWIDTAVFVAAVAYSCMLGWK